MSDAAFEHLPGRDPAILLLCDHAANAVPPDIDLAIDRALLERHIAWDIGAAALTRDLARRLDARAVLGTVSRLVIDLNRAPGHPGLVPQASDGHAIPGNRDGDVAARFARFHAPYHAHIAEEIARARPELIVAVHSFTPALETGDDGPRPWPIGLLYNQDARLAQWLLHRLREQGIDAGDNQPYSGKQLNATLDLHAEARGIACVSIEVRNDELGDAAGVGQWAAMLAGLLIEARNGLARMQARAQ